MSEHNWHKRHAIQLACQLPDDKEDAIQIIRELQNLVDTWLHPAKPVEVSKVFALVRDRS
jgi:hypothetical protein